MAAVAPSPRGERTRASILAHAEALFASHGFAATRLADVAAAVGIRRASIVYHFKDKQALYEAVLADLVGALEERIARAFDTPGTTAERALEAVSAWLDFVSERPTFGRLLLREIASIDAAGPAPPLAGPLQSFAERVRRFDAERDARGEDFEDAIDPVHLATSIAGTTVLYASALQSLVPEGARAAAQAGHRGAVLAIARRLLGIADAKDPVLEENPR